VFKIKVEFIPTLLFVEEGAVARFGVYVSSAAKQTFLHRAWQFVKSLCSNPYPNE
jgi:hypothetical protein